MTRRPDEPLEQRIRHFVSIDVERAERHAMLWKLSLEPAVAVRFGNAVLLALFNQPVDVGLRAPHQKVSGGHQNHFPAVLALITGAGPSGSMSIMSSVRWSIVI